MNFGENWVLIVAIAAILMLFFLARRGGGVRRHPEIVQNLLYDVRLNQALVETYHLREKPKKFDNTNWQINKNRIDFLEEELQETLHQTFDVVEDFNQQIKTAKKLKSDSFRSLDVGKLKELLAKCRKGLEDWMMDKIGKKELPPKYPSLLGGLFGER